MKIKMTREEDMGRSDTARDRINELERDLKNRWDTDREGKKEGMWLMVYLIGIL